VLRKLPLHKLERRYFFETDMLYRLNTIRAVVHDVPMDAVYADEESNLKISKVLPEFLGKHVSRIFRRYFYLYLLSLAECTGSTACPVASPHLAAR
jgi:hypothetical protein